MLANKSSNLWNLKEQNYPRFSYEKCEFQRKVIEISNSWGVEYAGKEIIEIGCGTGNYTFLLAGLGAKVYALDFSQKMLDVLENDAKKFELSQKIVPLCEDFLKFKSDKVYDIAFAAMTPALFSDDAFLKFTNLAKVRVWLGWAGKRESGLMSEIFNSHGHAVHAHNTSKDLKAWLEKNKIPYKNQVLEDVWEHKFSTEEAVNDQAWHLKMHKITPNLEKIESIVRKFADKNGEVYEKTEVTLEVIKW
ncbi:MAG: methyltransferase domain-containing protein [Campylobacteraceae bacterium]|nr:methyltransferase domain-containing protein [Campylobacteraceae bacterium]